MDNPPKKWLYYKGSPGSYRPHEVLGFNTDSPRADKLAAEVCKVLDIANYSIDDEGYQSEIICAEYSEKHDMWAWMQSWADGTHWDDHDSPAIDVSFGVILIKNGIILQQWEPYTYNPYFGCVPEFMDWLDDNLILIYGEKHTTYAARIKPGVKTKYVELESYWIVRNETIFHKTYDGKEVRSTTLPELEEGSVIGLAEAKKRGLNPDT